MEATCKAIPDVVQVDPGIAADVAIKSTSCMQLLRQNLKLHLLLLMWIPVLQLRPQPIQHHTFSTTAKFEALPDIVQVYFCIVAVAGFGSFSLASHQLHIGFIEVGVRDQDHALNGQKDLKQAAVLGVPLLGGICAMPCAQQ